MWTRHNEGFYYKSLQSIIQSKDFKWLFIKDDLRKGVFLTDPCSLNQLRGIQKSPLRVLLRVKTTCQEGYCEGAERSPSPWLKIEISMP